MEQKNTPIETARQTLIQLMQRKLPPTPDNFRSVYDEIMGVKSIDKSAELGKTLEKVLHEAGKQKPKYIAAAQAITPLIEKSDWSKLEEQLRKLFPSGAADAEAGGGWEGGHPAADRDGREGRRRALATAVLRHRLRCADEPGGGRRGPAGVGVPAVHARTAFQFSPPQPPDQRAFQGLPRGRGSDRVRFAHHRTQRGRAGPRSVRHAWIDPFAAGKGLPCAHQVGSEAGRIRGRRAG